MKFSMDIQALSEQIFITANPYYFACSNTIRAAFLFYLQQNLF